MSGALLAAVLANPASAAALDAAGWQALIGAARAERLIGTLAIRLGDMPMPAAVARIMADARRDSDRERLQALWEADRAWAVLKPLGVRIILMKGTAYVAADLNAGQGRSIGDLDIMVPQAALPAVEAALIEQGGWEWVKPDPYDDAYYRQWMHELPPLIHQDRDRMIDVHHTILPPTARPTPDAGAMIADSLSLTDGLRIFSPPDMVCHAVAHLLADGDLAGGMRNLWDIRCLLTEFAARDGFGEALQARAVHHQLLPHVQRAVRLASEIYGAPVPNALTSPKSFADRLYRARLLARDGWGRETRPVLRFAFYIRSHWLRMPPLMLARHLWTKWRKSKD